MDVLNQAKNLIAKSQNILIIPESEIQGDKLGSALALFFTLKKLGKNVNLLTGKIPEKFNFLVNPDLSPAGSFVISVNTAGKEISKMRYEKNNNDLKIYLALDKGEIKNEDVSFLRQRTFGEAERNPDLLIALGIQSLEGQEQLLGEAPILNIDNQPNNENFGEVNIIETTSSLAEIVTNLIELMDEEKELFNEEIATCLLTGLIWSSQNFRNPRTRPKTFKTSAFLIEKGADHQKIIQHLYKQKSISQIKLLGRILEKLNFHDVKDVYSASLTANDFQDCHASSKDLAFVLEELKFHFRHLPNLLILWESHASPPLVKGIFYSPNLNLTEKISENFESVSRGQGVLFLTRDNDLISAEEKILSIL